MLVGPDGATLTRKVLSATGDYASAILAGVVDLLAAVGVGGDRVVEVLHGTTVATNAILERRGAKTGLLTTDGFRDVLEIGRMRLAGSTTRLRTPAPLVPGGWEHGGGGGNPAGRSGYRSRDGGRRVDRW